LWTLLTLSDRTGISWDIQRTAHTDHTAKAISDQRVVCTKCRGKIRERTKCNVCD
jgi:hypothetical protein